MFGGRLSSSKAILRQIVAQKRPILEGWQIPEPADPFVLGCYGPCADADDVVADCEARAWCPQAQVPGHISSGGFGASGPHPRPASVDPWQPRHTWHDRGFEPTWPVRRPALPWPYSSRKQTPPAFFRTCLTAPKRCLFHSGCEDQGDHRQRLCLQSCADPSAAGLHREPADPQPKVCAAKWAGSCATGLETDHRAAPIAAWLRSSRRSHDCQKRLR